jgi:hypothetical protein
MAPQKLQSLSHGEDQIDLKEANIRSILKESKLS